MKTLANCSPVDFLRQTNRIRKRVAAWLDLTKIMEIRKTMPEIDDKMSPEELKAAKRKQARENLDKILDSAMELHPEETAEILGLVCFVEPQDLNSYKMIDFLPAISEILNSQEVVDFFMSLMSWERTDTST